MTWLLCIWIQISIFDEVIHPLTNQVNFIYNGVILFINLFSVTLAMCSFCIRKFINNCIIYEPDIQVLNVKHWCWSRSLNLQTFAYCIFNYLCLTWYVLHVYLCICDLHVHMYYLVPHYLLITLSKLKYSASQKRKKMFFCHFIYLIFQMKCHFCTW